MTIQGLPDSAAVVATIEVAQFMRQSGELGVAYGFEGMSKDSAIGFLTVVLDRLREERSLEWDTCPGCGLPWEEHDATQDEDEEG